MRVLVLGGYGLVGLTTSKQLIRDGHTVIGLARSARKGHAVLSAIEWIEADISKLTQPQYWLDYIADIDVVVNASGALQNGLSDNVTAVQRDAIVALITACEQSGGRKFIQISAPDADEHSKTLFYQTKAAADKALKESSLDWVIFRPGLVISSHAYGGTALLRTLAAFPVIQPVIMADIPIQTIAVTDVARAICEAIEMDISGKDIDLVEPESQTLAEVVLNFRSWLGFKNPITVWVLPKWIGSFLARMADGAGWFGWRSALRTTSISVLAEGVQGNSKPWSAISKQPVKSLAETLEALPSSLQERIYARAMLAFPIMVIILAGFWLASGVVGIVQHSAAVELLYGAVPTWFAAFFVRTGSIVDIMIGAALLFRPITRIACMGSILVSTCYLAASALLTPELWSDPLGPMVKVFPAIGLAVIVAALAEER